MSFVRPIRNKGTITLVVALSITAIVASLTYAIIRLKTPKKPGDVVILYGTSSSGKTSIINELKKIYGNNYQVVDADSFLRTHNPPEEKEIKLESPEEKDLRISCIFINMFYCFVREKALKGNNILVDTVPVIDIDAEYAQVLQVLKGLKVVKVLLYCPLDCTLAHVEKRNLTGVKDEHRDVATPIPQYMQLYKVQELDSEKVIDKIVSKDLKQIMKSAIDASMKSLLKEIAEITPKELHEDCFRQKGKDFRSEKNRTPFEEQWLKEEVAKHEKELDEIYKKLVQQFKLDQLDEVAIVPKTLHDLILDCRHTPVELAKEIVEFLKKTN
jgi:chloramphenicol 3-O-phosphotransferase